jgi:hypothetical protein
MLKRVISSLYYYLRISIHSLEATSGLLPVKLSITGFGIKMRIAYTGNSFPGTLIVAAKR